jgi:hypothetical protein
LRLSGANRLADFDQALGNLLQLDAQHTPPVVA